MITGNDALAAVAVEGIEEERLDAGLSLGGVFAPGVPSVVLVGGVKLARMADKIASQVPNRLPDETIVCRGGTFTADRFRTGSHVKVDEGGNLQNASCE